MGDLLLPPGAVLLHVGPHKTGTSTLQSALHRGRPALLSHGVVYPGRVPQSAERAALGLTGFRGLRGVRPPSRADWVRLQHEVARADHGHRVVVSSEFFGEADVDIAREVVDGLGEDRVHVLVTVRPLTHILPSAWQQYVRNGQVITYDAWLKGMLKRPPYDKPTPSFWRRHRHDLLVERWASVVGLANLTVLVVDENDRDLLTHSVEAMLGLPLGILQPEAGRSNRSLTWGEIELVRQLNLEFRARGWPEELYRATVFPMVKNLQESHRPGPDEQLITTPGWALDRAAEIGAAAAEAIAASGVRVVGDLSVLGSRPPDQRELGVVVPPQLPSVAAKDAMAGMIARWDRLPFASGMAVADRMRELVRTARSSKTVGRLERRVRPLASGIER